MHANTTNSKVKLIYPELSFTVVGICFQVHNKLGRFAREKQYGDLIELRLKEKNIAYKRELRVGNSGNILDFIIEDKIILELKTKPFVTKEHYYQLQRYLHSSGFKLGLLVNFRSRYIHPKRVIRTELPKHTYPQIIIRSIRIPFVDLYYVYSFGVIP